MPTTKSYKLRALTTYNGSEEAIEQLQAATEELTEVKETLTGIIRGTAARVLNQDDNGIVRDGAFDGCVDLIEYSNIRNGLVNIGENAFRNCISLTTIPYCYFQRTLLGSTLGARAFYNCSSLAELNGEYTTSNPIFNIDVPEYCFYGCSSLNKSISLPTANYIGEGAFKNSGINAVSIGTLVETSNHVDSITIYPYAFENCQNLTRLTVGTRNGEAVTIYDGAFKNCSHLATISQVNNYLNIIYIGSNAFQNCTSLTSITFQAGIVIDPEAFNGCSNLREFIFRGTVEQARASFSNGIGASIPLTQIMCSDGTYVIGS